VDDQRGAERREREDFVVEAAWAHARLLPRRGAYWSCSGFRSTTACATSPPRPCSSCFSLFAKVTPNLRKIGLPSDHLRERMVAVGAIAADA
jgi:hypothetical protein